MGLCMMTPEPSGRMGILWTVGLIGESAVLEFGSMGHMIYAEKWMYQTGITHRAPLYTTHITEKEIALGMTDKIRGAIEEIIEMNNPKAIFVLPSSVPETIGMDIESVCEEIQVEFESTKIIYFNKGGFREKLSDGIEEALFKIVKHIPEDVEINSELTCNIIGSCVDFSRYDADIMELKRILKGSFNMEVICVLSSDTTVTQIQKMGSAHINLVLRREGEKAAKALKRTFGTPYILNRPYGFDGTVEWLDTIATTLEISYNSAFVESELEESKNQKLFVKQMIKVRGSKMKLAIGEHVDLVEGIRKFAVEEMGFDNVSSFTTRKKYASDSIPYYEEEKQMEEFLSATIVMGNATAIDSTTKDRNLVLSRGINSWDFNPYVPPFVGFRGARNLCDLWLYYNVNGK